MAREITYRYCPECAAPLESLAEGSGPARPVCRACGLVIHQDPKVACASLVIENGQVLLLKRARPPQRSLWCLPGGFADRGEPLEEAAVRETREETGLIVIVRRLFGLYSYAGYPVVVAIFETERQSGRLTVNAESKAARWYKPDNIPFDRLAFPSAREALESWVKDRSGN